MLQRIQTALAVALLAVALSGCGGEDGTNQAAAPATTAAATEQAEDEATVLVTRDCGRTVVVERTDVPAGQTAMQALQRVADVETDQGGKFVTAIEGIEQDTDAQLAWLFYVNGKEAQTGAAEVTLGSGDVEWWDYHDWEETCAVPAEAK